jgi:cysteine synthase|tara:strand:- start:16006 stop:16179 length:174 start_codon:yes stop_codon:yes gene_type:complete
MSKNIKISDCNGLFVGISSGANILAAERWAEDNPNVEGNIITFLCDRGGRYFSCLED